MESIAFILFFVLSLIYLLLFVICTPIKGKLEDLLQDVEKAIPEKRSAEHIPLFLTHEVLKLFKRFLGKGVAPLGITAIGIASFQAKSIFSLQSDEYHMILRDLSTNIGFESVWLLILGILLLVFVYLESNAILHWIERRSANENCKSE